MKLRSIPEDFVVEEVPDFTPDPAGHYFVYRITKRSIATFDVMDILRKALRIPGHFISASGLKDKHALATQLISLPKPLPASFKNDAFEAAFVGKSASPLKTTNIAGNRFIIAARGLDPHEVETMGLNADAIRACGVPNYYDSQRFGGGGRDELVGRSLLLQRYEEALRLHLATPRRKQSMKDKRIRRICAEHWNDWKAAIGKLPRCRERSIIAYLCDHPENYRGALERIDTKVMSLYLAAYQSLLFNDTLVAFVTAQLDPVTLARVKYKAGELLFWRSLPVEMFQRWREQEMPLLSHSTDLNAYPDEIRTAVEEALTGDDVTLDRLVLKGFDRLHLRGTARSMLVVPQSLSLDSAAEDELNPGQLKVCARFTLPRGSFATVVMKRLGLKAQTRSV